jgi:hypothetical protein
MSSDNIYNIYIYIYMAVYLLFGIQHLNQPTLTPQGLICDVRSFIYISSVMRLYIIMCCMSRSAAVRGIGHAQFVHHTYGNAYGHCIELNVCRTAGICVWWILTVEL